MYIFHNREYISLAFQYELKSLLSINLECSFSFNLEVSDYA
jgi:hypothetical protein